MCAGLLAGGIWLMLPTEEKVIRQRLTKLAATSSIKPNESTLARIANANNLRDFFSPDVVVTLEIEDRHIETIHGRGELIQMATAARSRLEQARFQLLDITVQFGPDKQSATARMTLLGDVNGEKNSLAQELKMELKKAERVWLITHVETVRTLK